MEFLFDTTKIPNILLILLVIGTFLAFFTGRGDGKK